MNSTTAKSLFICESWQTDLAKETLIRQPPEKFFVALSIISFVKPRPAKMRRALGSAASAPIACSSSYTYAHKKYGNVHCLSA